MLGLLNDNGLKGPKTDKSALQQNGLKEDMTDIYFITNGANMMNMDLFIKS